VKSGIDCFDKLDKDGMISIKHTRIYQMLNIKLSQARMVRNYLCSILGASSLPALAALIGLFEVVYLEMKYDDALIFIEIIRLSLSPFLDDDDCSFQLWVD
jgi:hypothetical protein